MLPVLEEEGALRLLDSRRLTGPNLLLDRAGAVVEIAWEDAGEDEIGRAVSSWREEAARLLAAVGWPGEERVARPHPGGVSLAFTAPIDALYAATEVNEAAWAAARARLEGGAAPSAEVVDTLVEAIARERNPALVRLAAAAAARGVQFLWDEAAASVGSGTGSLTWPAAELPPPAEIDWLAVHDVPTLLVTGTNGKTTTVRLLAALAAAAGLTAGVSSTEQVAVGGEVLEQGDFSGPGGARTLLRDRRVEMAVLETARGGMLRRGLAVSRATAALVTNVAADHLGEYGIATLADLAEAKLVVAKAIGPEGRVVLNADDPELAARGVQSGRFRAPVVWFGLDPGSPLIAAHLAAGGEAALLEGDALVLRRGAAEGGRRVVARVGDLPIAFGGAARYNLANALAALALGHAAGLPAEAMAAGLAGFGRAPEENPGRANLYDVGGATVLLDYAHNPHGLAALHDLVASLPAARRLVLLGQAGDREDEAIRELARTAWRLRPDRVVIKELTAMLRGRAPGEVPAVLEDELRRLGAGDGIIERADDEIAGVRAALRWARPGDLLVLLVHTDREAAVELLRSWPGSP